MSGRGKSRRSRELVDAAYDILAEIQPASVRAVCYQLFTRGLIDSMEKRETNRVSTQLRDAREAGIIPWEWIVAETRAPECVSAWKDPAQYVKAVVRCYRRDRWIDQSSRLEVWSEKGSVRGTVWPVLESYGVTFRVLHGYGSATTIHQVADESLDDHRTLTAFYLGDWDPSGLHMSEVDVPRRLRKYGGNVEVIRLALDSFDRVGLPWFSAKEKKRDPRYKWFVEWYGDRCWELDAMSPVALRKRVDDAIHGRLDLVAWGRADNAERAETESLSTILARWPAISRQASK